MPNVTTITPPPISGTNRKRLAAWHPGNWTDALPTQVWIRYLVAVLVILLAIAVRLPLSAALQGLPHVTFFPAVMIAAVLGGFGPGLLAIALSLLSVLYLVPALGTEMGPPGEAAARHGVFLGLTLFTSTLLAALRHAFLQVRSERERAMRLAEERSALAAQRDTLLREVRHRVGNALQMASGLMLLQSRRMTGDGPGLAALEDALSRITLLAQVHQRLGEAGDERIEIAEQLRQMCADLVAALRPGTTELTVEAAAATLPPEQAISVAMIAHELVSNALEHAFAEGQPGHVRVGFSRGPAALQLTVEDNGKGPPPDITAVAGGGLGLDIVRALARQIDGTLEFATAPGGGTRVALAASR